MSRKKSGRCEMKGTKRLIIVSFAVAVLIFPALSGCKKSPPPRVTKADKATAASKATAKAEAATADTPINDQGYVYDRRDRRDPFVPLIITKKKKAKSGERMIGTLESYDIGDFKVLAIAIKGSRRYALLLAPGNRAFTVYEGTVLGLHNGMVEKITDNEVITIEKTENYRGKIESRQLILELHKGR